MDFPNDSLPILAGIICNTAKSMATTMKYIYAVSDEDFYNINVKDIFRLALTDVTDCTKLENLCIRTDKKNINDIFSGVEFSRVQHMISYSLAVRLPFCKKQIEDFPLKDKQLKALYDSIMYESADNFGNIISETFDDNSKLIKQKQPLPAYNSEWFRRYVYTYIPSLGEINNKNLYFLGCVEAMFPLYYSSLIAQLKKVMFLLGK